MRYQATCCLLLILGGTGLRAEDASEVVALRETIAQWVETESTISRERSEWQAEKESMERLMALHRRELELLADELDRAGGSADEYAARRDELRAEVEALKEVRDTVRQAVVRAKPRMLRVAGLFPQPLADETAADLRSLEQWQDHQEPRPALQAMLSMVGAAEQFHRRFTRSTELRGGREIEVLYLGLAAAYFRDGQDGAGVGRPGVDGWQWESRPELADPIRSAFDQLDKKRPPELVRLPLQITREGGGQ